MTAAVFSEAAAGLLQLARAALAAGELKRAGALLAAAGRALDQSEAALAGGRAE